MFIFSTLGKGFEPPWYKLPAVFETAALVRAWLPQQTISSFKSLIKPFFIWVSILVNIKVKLSRLNEKKEVQLEKKATINDLLRKLNLKPDTVVVMDKNKPIPIDDILIDGEELTIIQVSSGG